MGFFARRDEEDSERADALARIEAGGIPRQAEERLRGLGAPGSLFTSGLSVNEFALLDRMGPTPLAQVMGASVVRPGWQYLPALEPGVTVTSGSSWYGPTSSGMALLNRMTEPSASQIRNYSWHADVVCELDVMTDAWNVARETVRARLRGQVADAHAAGVVGVELSHSVRRDKFALASSIGSPSQRGWNRGSLGLPYYVRGRTEAQRTGWVITMHAAGTAIRQGRAVPRQGVETQLRIGGR